MDSKYQKYKKFKIHLVSILCYKDGANNIPSTLLRFRLKSPIPIFTFLFVQRVLNNRDSFSIFLGYKRKLLNIYSLAFYIGISDFGSLPFPVGLQSSLLPVFQLLMHVVQSLIVVLQLFEVDCTFIDF